jgi:hypothetical protein
MEEANKMGDKKLFLGFWGLVLVYVLFMGGLSLKYANNSLQVQEQINSLEEFKGLLGVLGAGVLEGQVKPGVTEEVQLPLQVNPFINKVVVAKKEGKVESFSSLHATQNTQQYPQPPRPPEPPPPPPPLPSISNQVPPSFPSVAQPPPFVVFRLQGENNGTVLYYPFWNATLQNATLQSRNATFPKKVLTSIIQTEEDKICVIDNKVYREGDEVKRHKILKIGEDYVELKGPKGNFKVKVGGILDI